MSDGAFLNLTVSVMADRARTKYGYSIAPDELVTDPAQVVNRAIEWLQTAQVTAVTRHSSRSAVIGSTRAARRAGMPAASAATASRPVAAAPSVHGSAGSMP